MWKHVSRAASSTSFGRTERPLLRSLPACINRNSSRCGSNGGGKGSPPASRSVDADDHGYPRRTCQSHMRFVVTVTVLVFIEKLRRLRCANLRNLRAAPASAVHGQSSEYRASRQKDSVDNMVRLKRVLRDALAEQLSIKRQVYRLHNTGSAVIRSRASLALQTGHGFDIVPKQRSSAIVTRRLDVRWNGAWVSPRFCRQRPAAPSCLHASAVVELDHGVHLMGHSVVYAHKFYLWQLRLQKTFFRCLSIFISPIGPTFSDVAQEGRVIPGKTSLHIGCVEVSKKWCSIDTVITSGWLNADCALKFPAIMACTFSRGAAMRFDTALTSIAAAVYCGKHVLQRSIEGEQLGRNSQCLQSPAIAVIQTGVKLMHNVSAGMIWCCAGIRRSPAAWHTRAHVPAAREEMAFANRHSCDGALCHCMVH